MTLTLTPLDAPFGLEVTGVDVRSTSDTEFAKIERAFEENSVLVFRDQQLDDASQIAFSARFGPLESTISSNPGGEGTAIAIFSNVDTEGALIPPKDKRMVFNTGNQMWHSDSSYKPVPAKASLLNGRVVPPEGGETEFACGRLAYDTLDASDKARLEPLVAVHDFLYSRGLIDKTLLNEKDRKELPPVRQKLVRENPVTGAKTLFAGVHASYIEGWEEQEGRALLQDLTARIVQPQNVYRHKWREGDLVMWDNRCCLHRGAGWDATRYKRVMHRTTVAGDGPTVEDPIVTAG